MASTDSKTLSKLFFFGRMQLPGHMSAAASDAISRYGRDPILVFFKAFGNLLQLNLQEAITELETIKDDSDVQLCTLMALIVAHKEQPHCDRDAVLKLDERLKERRRTAGENALRFAALFLALSNRPDKATQYADRILKINSSSFEGHVLRGWIYLMEAEINGNKKDEFRRRAEKDFESASSLQTNESEDPELLLGKVRCFEMKGDYKKALSILNSLRISHFEPKTIEKMRLELALGQWEDAQQLAVDCISTGSELCLLPALQMQIMYLLCREANYAEASNTIQKFIDQLHALEEGSAALFSFNAKLFSRMCGRNSLILQQAVSMMQHVVSIDASSNNLVEQGELLLKTAVSPDTFTTASNVFVKAMEADPDNARAMLGFNRCKLESGKTRDFDKIFNELEIIKESMSAGVTTRDESIFLANLLFTQAIILKQKGHTDKVFALIKKAVDFQHSSILRVGVGPEYLCALDADFRTENVKLLLKTIPPENISNSKQPNIMFNFAASVLDTVLKYMPGLFEAKYYGAYIKFLTGDLSTAESLLQDCIDRGSDADISDAHLLMAQIHVETGQFSKAESALSQALSLNFSVRNTPTYLLAKAKVHNKRQQFTDARKTLESALNLPGVRKVTGRARVNSAANTPTTPISDSERLTIFLELSECHRNDGNVHEATKVMQDAINEFKGTSEESRVVIANANLDLARGDVEGVLAALRQIDADKPYYISAREKMADIYLHHRNDKRMFAQCYKELVELQPNTRTKMLLGDAYMNILAIDKAIAVYQSAYKDSPNDVYLVKKIAQAFVKMHYYSQAITYFRNGYKKDPTLKYDLIDLLCRLRQFDDAERVLDESERHEQTYDLNRLMDEVKNFMARARIAEKRNQPQTHERFLNKAEAQQDVVLRRVKSEQPEWTQKQTELAIDINYELANLAISNRDLDKAVEIYQKCLGLNARHSKTQVKLIKTLLDLGNIEDCETHCVELLKSDPDNTDAIIMMADLMLSKHEFEDAGKYYRQLLDRSPDNCKVLLKAVGCLRRLGKLSDVKALFDAAIEHSPKIEMDAGFIYANAYYELYMGKVGDAMRLFNKCRKVKEYGEGSLCEMIRICLNPDNNVLGAEAFEDVAQSNSYGSEKSDLDSMALKTGEKLLAELKKSYKDSSEYGILQAYHIMSAKTNSAVNEAINLFNNLMPSNPVGCILGVASGYMISKNMLKARGELKKLYKEYQWNLADSEHFEKAYLLLADVMIQSNKYEIAHESLKKCLQYNKSCYKAYEYSGLVFEKEQSYKEAAERYALAWKYSHKTDPSIGYKLAYNYLKAKRYIDAIDISNEVLANHESYPKIRKDILEKARAAFRT